MEAIHEDYRLQEPDSKQLRSPTKIAAFGASNNGKNNIQNSHNDLKNLNEEGSERSENSNFFDELAYFQSSKYNNFKRYIGETSAAEVEKYDEIVDFSKLRNDQRNLMNSKKRISEESTLVSFQKKFSRQQGRKISNSSGSGSERTLQNTAITGNSSKNNKKKSHSKFGFLKTVSLLGKSSNENIASKTPEDKISEECDILINLLASFCSAQRGHENSDDIQYLILSSKFFQSTSFDSKGSDRVFSIPLKQSMVNLTTFISPDSQRGETEGFHSFTCNTDLTEHLNILNVIMALKRLKKFRLFRQVPYCYKLITIFLSQSITKQIEKQVAFKNYLSNFINNLESFNFKLQRLECENNIPTCSLIKSSVTPTLLKILMSLEQLLSEGISTSEDFWSYYLPMFFQNIDFLESLTYINETSDINEFIFQFKKVIQLYLLFLIPSANSSNNSEHWKTVFPNLKINSKCPPALRLQKFVESFDEINNCLTTGKDLLGDVKLLEWSKRQNSIPFKKEEKEGDIQSPTSQSYEYSELMEKIGLEEEISKANDSIVGTNDYAKLQSTLQNILVSFSINSPIKQIDTEINHFLNSWTNVKLALSNTLNLTGSEIINYDSTPLSVKLWPLIPAKPCNNKFLDTLKTLSDIELNDKLQLKLKELHMENVGAQKKISQLSLAHFNDALDSKTTHFKNLREDDIALYYEIDEIKQRHELQENEDQY